MRLLFSSSRIVTIFFSSLVPSWVRAPNFASLVNLPDRVMPHFGPLRELWEGGMIGEGCVKHVRPHVHGMRAGWSAGAHRRTLLFMQSENFFPASKSNDLPTRKMYHIYDSPQTIRSSLNDGFPISGVVHSDPDGSVSIFVVFEKRRKMVKITPGPVQMTRRGAQYFKFVPNSVHDYKVGQQELYCVLLPSFHDNVLAHALVSSNWRELRFEEDKHVLNRPCGLSVDDFTSS